MSGVTIKMDGRTALITGGSRGIGLAIGKRFAEAGADVILLARRVDKLEEAKAEIDGVAPGKTTIRSCDVSRRDELAALCDALTAEKREIDILVNNAGTSQRGPFETLTDEFWQSDFDLKLFAAIRLVRFAVPGMKARKWGRILNILSVQGKTPSAEGAPTAVSRAAGIAMSKIMAGEFAPYNVLVNALCTGSIMSDQVTKGYKTVAEKMSFEEYLKERGKLIPMGRIGEAEEYANMALFLASDMGSYITGTAINIDGGLCKVS